MVSVPFLVGVFLLHPRGGCQRSVRTPRFCPLLSRGLSPTLRKILA